MKQLIYFTIQEVLNSRIFRLLLLAPLVLMVVALTFTGLFMLDLGKVFIDTMFASTHLLCFTFLMFLAAPFLARDIDAHFTYILLTLPISRGQYLLGRFIGLCATFLLLIIVLIIVTSLSLELASSIWGSYMATADIGSMVLGIFLIAWQYLSLIAIALFVFSWATGSAEILSFTFLIWLLSWFFPPVLTAMQDSEVAQTIPPFLHVILESCYQLVPHLTGGEIANRLAHGISLQGKEIIYYLIEHTAYATILFTSALILFRRRNL
ncbi:hypothetical protein ACFL48_03895 [Pseudomonadota bacterium]